MELFDPGQVIITASAMLVLTDSQVDPRDLLRRHVEGDWGTLTDSELKSNEDSIQNGGPVFSDFETPGGNRIGVITAPDRSVTVFVEFPRESLGSHRRILESELS